MHQAGLLFITVAMSGCLSGFLIFNRTPARIFMGDTGSMFLGFIVAYLSINFIELNKPNVINIMKPAIESAPSIVLGLLIIPIFDTLRIFSIRVVNRKSPFEADSNHIHHRLIDLGLTHLQSTGILILVNIVSLLLALLFSSVRNEYQFLIIITFCITANGILSFLHSKRLNKKSIKRIHPSSYQLEKKLIVLNDKQLLN
jgi:UDP-N-acetylmuramyl pentapeptide phosphotransferase/UDP-N-acetylglucosamine-1-phosphate transferase